MPQRQWTTVRLRKNTVDRVKVLAALRGSNIAAVVSEMLDPLLDRTKAEVLSKFSRSPSEKTRVER
jgi:hypothetical protein